MNTLVHRIPAGWPEVLHGLIEQARSQGPNGLFAFDLDSTLFDNRPRQARIVREFGDAHCLEPLRGCRPEHFSSGWDMRAALRACGLPADQTERIFDAIRRFWMERFFTSEYCVDDIAVNGAVAFVTQVLNAPATVCYVTGRHEGMRAGTEEALRKCGFPLPGGAVHLIMKPTFEMGDDDFKREAHLRLKGMGTVLAAFDNEPMHANDYRRAFPQASVIHLATDHSGRPIELLEGIVSVPYFSVAQG